MPHYKMLYFLYKIGEFLAFRLPSGLFYRLADFLGSVYFIIARKSRNTVFANMRVILKYISSSNHVSYKSRMVFVNFARYLAEFFRSPKIDLEYIANQINFTGKEHLEQALAKGRGVLLLSAHMGSWEMGAIVLSMRGYKINVVAWTHRDRRINDFFLKRRQNKGVQVIPLGSGIKRVFTALKNNEIVAILGDIDYGALKAGITVKLFGQDTVIPRGPALFSLRTGAPIVPIFVHWQKDGKIAVSLQQELFYKPCGDIETDVINLAAKIAEVIEKNIAQYPEQWLMFASRWDDVKTIK
ncbi:MAG: lysophospholipid acyltransferase family protein [Candidatus Omnitrophota bacterium]